MLSFTSTGSSSNSHLCVLRLGLILFLLQLLGLHLSPELLLQLLLSELSQLLGICVLLRPGVHQVISRPEEKSGRSETEGNAQAQKRRDSVEWHVHLELLLSLLLSGPGPVLGV